MKLIDWRQLKRNKDQIRLRCLLSDEIHRLKQQVQHGADDSDLSMEKKRVNKINWKTRSIKISNPPVKRNRASRHGLCLCNVCGKFLFDTWLAAGSTQDGRPRLPASCAVEGGAHPSARGAALWQRDRGGRLSTKGYSRHLRLSSYFSSKALLLHIESWILFSCPCIIILCWCNESKTYEFNFELNLC